MSSEKPNNSRLDELLNTFGAQFEMSRRYGNRLLEYRKSESPVNLIVPSCPGFIPDDEITGTESRIIAPNLHPSLTTRLGQINELRTALEKLDIETKTTVVLMRPPKYGGVRLSHVQNTDHEDAYNSMRQLLAQMEYDTEVVDTSDLEDMFASRIQGKSNFQVFFQNLYNRESPHLKLRLNRDYLRMKKLKGDYVEGEDDYKNKLFIDMVIEQMAFEEHLTLSQIPNPLIYHYGRPLAWANRRNALLPMEFLSMAEHSRGTRNQNHQSSLMKVLQERQFCPKILKEIPTIPIISLKSNK